MAEDEFQRVTTEEGVGVAEPSQEAKEAAEFGRRADANQRSLGEALQSRYDYIVCGAGSSGSVVARRLAEDAAVTVLLLEAGGSDEVPSIIDPGSWFTNLGTERDWCFAGEPNPDLNGRCMPLSMGKALGGGSSINVMIWSRGHRNDWEFFAAESGDPRWSYESVLGLYRGIEDYQGAPDERRRGKGGLVYVQDVPDPLPIAPAMLEACRGVGIPTFADQNGEMMEGDGGAALPNVRFRAGQRLNVFTTYVRPLLDRPNLTVLTGAAVRRLSVRGTRVTGVELTHGGRSLTIEAGREVVLSTGAINTPKILMQSGIGDAAELRRHGIGVVSDLPGVGQNFQDHLMVAGCVWEYETPLPYRNNAAEATFFWKSDSALDTPDLQPFQIELPYTSEETRTRFQPSADCWSLSPGIVRPKSRGEVRITGAEPETPVRIFANALAEPDDMTALLRCTELCREIGNSAAFKGFNKREVMPGPMQAEDLRHFIRDAAVTYWHQSGTAKMGRDRMAVVDGRLRVHGVEGLRVADASIMPRVTTGNTMAPCVIIGEQAAAAMKA